MEEATEVTEETAVTSDPTVAETFASRAEVSGYVIGFWLVSLVIQSIGLYSTLEDQNTWGAALCLLFFTLSLVKAVAHTTKLLGWLVGSYIDEMRKPNPTEASDES